MKVTNMTLCVIVIINLTIETLKCQMMSWLGHLNITTFKAIITRFGGKKYSKNQKVKKPEFGLKPIRIMLGNVSSDFRDLLLEYAVFQMLSVQSKRFPLILLSYNFHNIKNSYHGVKTSNKFCNCVNILYY